MTWPVRAEPITWTGGVCNPAHTARDDQGVTRIGPIAFLPVLALALTLAGCGGNSSEAGRSTVLYEVLGDGKANNITYSADGRGGLVQEANVSLPWRKEVTFDGRSFKIGNMNAQNAGDGSITCRISVDGKVVKELTSPGRFSVVSCLTDPL